MMTYNAPYRDEEPSPFTFQDARSEQQRIIDRQDEGLEQIYEALRRTKKVGAAIGTEIDQQDELIDDIRVKTDHVNDKLITETRHTESLTQKSSTCLMWTIIVCLAIAIVLIGILG
ncbi:syntaxin-8-like isoform X2 [Symsagittifera roscoffensis]|uniref:syntaxin-8-like isoform X2 n=1 Tax=Symsagittifera roscoffensis TaxID=84072 RepID=UPI00307BB382